MFKLELPRHLHTSHIAISIVIIVTIVFLLGQSASQTETVESKIVYVPGSVIKDQGIDYFVDSQHLVAELQKTIDKLNAEGYCVVSTAPVTVGTL